MFEKTAIVLIGIGAMYMLTPFTPAHNKWLDQQERMEIMGVKDFGCLTEPRFERLLDFDTKWRPDHNRYEAQIQVVLDMDAANFTACWQWISRYEAILQKLKSNPVIMENYRALQQERKSGDLAGEK